MRLNTRIGDVFSVKMNGGKQKFFQLIAFDSTQLNSDVIRAFKTEYPVGAAASLSEIVNGEVDFYAHCVTKFGLKMKLWEKVGNINILGELSGILFRGSSDSGVGPGEELVEFSERWYVWHINDADFTRVGKLEGENRKVELGLIVNPYDIVERMNTGKYSFLYPGFR